ncbi:uncharacterized protein LOC110421029 [Herrania umbratica]|uniref:Uncharacterized protein LOC110421029 n=1 Tax=Herrania umbratica TaxID=108875 RepID=A0A6J1AT47_9ROSI|nr:uncharacterized protein LOC110421029 [Herrania umbratica]
MPTGSPAPELNFQSQVQNSTIPQCYSTLSDEFAFTFALGMDGLACASATTAAAAASFSVNKFLLFPSASALRAGLKRGAKRVSFRVFSAKEEPKFDKWDQMELKFGRLLGEDPKLTLAKIMGRKANPEASYIEIEKAFYKNKGKIIEVEEVPFDVEKKSPTSSSDGLNLVRPVPKKGIKFKADDNPTISEIKRPTLSDGKTVDSAKKGRVPNVILRKPTLVNEDDVEDLPRFRIKPNLSLKMRNKKAKDHFSEMTLLRKPEPMSVDTSHDKKQDSEDGVGQKEKEVEDRIGDFTLLGKSEQSIHTNIREMQELFEDLGIEGKRWEAESEANMLANAAENTSQESLDSGHSSIPKKPKIKDDSISGMQPVELSHRVSTEESSTGPSIEAALQGKPKRLDQSVKETSNSSRAQTVPINPEDSGDLPSVSPQEDSDWTRVEHLLKTGERAEVELISSSTRGFVVSLGSLIGFLPYRNLAAKWKFLAFESWLRQKGLDPAAYKQNLGVIGSSDIMSKNSSLVSNSDMENNQQFEGKFSSDMNLEDLFRIYDQEKLKFLSSFVGQRVKVNVLMANRKFRKLIVSLRPKEKEELVEKKRNVMAKLRVGDVVKCCIKKITYFGIFVEVEGVPALIHQTEVSWDATLDPASYFKIGQIVEAKVHQLDFTLDRVFLSLKEITPDPLIEALESVTPHLSCVPEKKDASLLGALACQ